MWRKEHGRAIVNAVNEGFANVAISDLHFFMVTVSCLNL